MEEARAPVCVECVLTHYMSRTDGGGLRCFHIAVGRTPLAQSWHVYSGGSARLRGQGSMCHGDTLGISGVASAGARRVVGGAGPDTLRCELHCGGSCHVQCPYRHQQNRGGLAITFVFARTILACLCCVPPSACDKDALSLQLAVLMAGMLGSAHCWLCRRKLFCQKSMAAQACWASSPYRSSHA